MHINVSICVIQFKERNSANVPADVTYDHLSSKTAGIYDQVAKEFGKLQPWHVHINHVFK